MKSWAPPDNPYDKQLHKEALQSVKRTWRSGAQRGGGILVALAIPILIIYGHEKAHGEKRSTGIKIIDDITTKIHNRQNSNGNTTITSPGIPEMNHTLQNHMRNMGHERLEREMREAHNHEIYGVRNLEERLAVLQNNRHTH